MKGSTMTIKTTKRNYLFIVQKRIGNRWCRIAETIFEKRKDARACSVELNNVAGITGRGPNRRYRVAKLAVAAPPSKAE